MADLNPKVLFDLIAAHVPGALQPHILIVGSLAAAYHHRDVLQHHGINTKDAAVIIHRSRVRYGIHTRDGEFIIQSHNT